MRYHHDHRKSRGFRKYRPGQGRLRNRMDRLTQGVSPYRSRQGIVMGVCRGLAEYFSFSVFWTRVIVLVLFFFTGFWPVGVLYLVAGFLLRPAPVIPLENDLDEEFYHSYTSSRPAAIQRIKRKFDNLDRRIQRMEDRVTSREFDL